MPYNILHEPWPISDAECSGFDAPTYQLRPHQVGFAFEREHRCVHSFRFGVNKVAPSARRARVMTYQAAGEPTPIESVRAIHDGRDGEGRRVTDSL